MLITKYKCRQADSHELKCDTSGEYGCLWGVDGLRCLPVKRFSYYGKKLFSC